MLNTVQHLLFSLVTALVLFPQSVANASVDKVLEELGWTEMLFNDRSANRFTANESGGIDVASEGSASLLRMPVSIDIKTRPILNWRWCLTEAAPATPLSIKGADDRSLAIYIAFPFVPEEATTFERIARKIVEARAGKDAPGRVLMYVWGGEQARGTVVASPYLGTSGKMTILRPAKTPSHQWFQESINIADDYQKFFGTPPPNPLYIAISADTDDTKSTSRGVVLDLKFLDPARVL